MLHSHCPCNSYKLNNSFQEIFVEEGKSKTYSTREICSIVKVSKNTLLSWLGRGFINPPAERTVYQFLWNDDNLSNIQSYVNRRIRGENK